MNFHIKFDSEKECFHFQREDVLFSFYFSVKENFLFLDDFKVNRNHSFFDIFLERNPHFLTDLQDCLEYIFDYAEKKNYFAVFMSFLPTYTANSFDLINNLKIKRLFSEGKREFHQFKPILNLRSSYVYYEFQPNFISDLISSYVLFMYHTLRQVSREYDLFYTEDHSNDIYYEGLETTLCFKIKKDGLYIVDPSISMDLNITNQRTNIKQMIKHLDPYLTKMKTKSRLDHILNSEYFFADMYFRKYIGFLKRDKKYMKIIEFLLQQGISKREIEVAFWKNLHFHSIRHCKFELYNVHLELFGFYFVIQSKEGEFSIYQSKEEYLQKA